VIDWDEVNLLKVAGVAPVPLPAIGAVCVMLARPLVLVMVTNAVRAPVAFGVKVNWRPHVPAAAKVALGAGQLLTNGKSATFGPVSAMLVSVTAAAPGLVTLMVCGPLVVPDTCGLKIRLGGFSASTVAAEAAGGAAMTMPKGVVIGIVAVTVFVETSMTDTVLLAAFKT